MRTKKFNSVEEMQETIDAYFERCKSSDKPMTVEGLACALDIDRSTLQNYEKEAGYELFFPTVKKAKSIILQDMVERSLEGKSNATITIFLLKNNNGYRDQQEVKLSDSFEIDF